MLLKSVHVRVARGVTYCVGLRCRPGWRCGGSVAAPAPRPAAGAESSPASARDVRMCLVVLCTRQHSVARALYRLDDTILPMANRNCFRVGGSVIRMTQICMASRGDLRDGFAPPPWLALWRRRSCTGALPCGRGCSRSTAASCSIASSPPPALPSTVLSQA